MFLVFVACDEYLVIFLYFWKVVWCLLVFYWQVYLGIPRSRGLIAGSLRDWEHDGSSNTLFRQIRAARYVIPYVLLGGLYCLRVRWCVMLWRGSYPPSLIKAGGIGLHEILDRYEPKSPSRVLFEWFPSVPTSSKSIRLVAWRMSIGHTPFHI